MDHKFKKGDCIYRNSSCGKIYGEIIGIHMSLDKYVIEWCDANPETTNERFEDIDSDGYFKIEKYKLLSLAL